MKSALLSCFLLFSLLVQSQSWCPAGAQWAYRLQCPEMNTHANIWLEKDTIIDSQPCKKIAGIETYLSSRVPVVYYTYESNDTVFFYYQGDFWPTYFFNAALGDTLTVKNNYDSYCDSFLTMLVDSVSINVVNGDSLRYYRTHYVGNNPPNPSTWSMQVLERYGALDNNLLPEIVCFGGADPCYYSLACYQDSMLDRDSRTMCRDMFTGIEIVNMVKDVILYPNPVSYQLNISVEGHQVTQYQMFDYTGKSVLESTNIGSNITVDVSMLPLGIYLVKLTVDNGQFTFRRFIREN